MQTKQLKTGVLYAVTRNGKRDTYDYSTPELATALGPYYLAGPQRYAYGGQIRKDERGYMIVADSKVADGVALLKADVATAKRVEALLDDKGQWTDPAIPDVVRSHVTETLALLQTGERIDFRRLDAPDGWFWEVEKASHVVGKYDDELMEQRRTRAAHIARKGAANLREQDNEARKAAVVAELKGLETGVKELYWHGYAVVRTSSDPSVIVSLSILEKLLGLD